jgi:hypothetical protein
MRRSRSVSAGLASSLALSALAAALVSACGEDGETANCPALKALYDIGAAGERNAPEVEAERRSAVDAGCMTDLAQPSPL